MKNATLVEYTARWEEIHGLAKGESSKQRSMSLIIFFTVLALECAGAYYFLYLNNATQHDALSRTANAFFVLYTIPQKLASIGFVWNPLPSLLQLPLLLFAKAWEPLATHGLSGGFVTAGFAAFNASYLYGIFKYYKQSTSMALILIALFTFNPFMFYYGCNGMSEMPFFTTQIICICSLLKWVETRETLNLVKISIALVIGFFCRYELFAFAAGIGIATLIIVYFMQDPGSQFKKTFKMKTEYFISTCIVIFLPVVYAIFVWLILNWTLMGDPLYFLSSTYSNSAQTANDLSDSFIKTVTSPVSAFFYMGVRLLPFILPFIPIVAERIFTLRLQKADFFIFVSLIFTLVAFHYYMLIKGSSYGWLRFSSYAMPAIIALIPYELSKIKRLTKDIVLTGIVMCFLISAALIPSVYFKSYELAAEEFTSFYIMDASFTTTQRNVAAAINEKYADGLILADSVGTGTVILNLEHPENMVINSSDIFEDALLNPAKYDIRYILIINPMTAGRMDRIKDIYPGFYENGAEWCYLAEDFGDARLYALW